ncbi:MAG TPA: cytochrome c peroxidase, partial [Myxococcota bacterium]|nr:cytochrome c peroxidase [Myxococcota bacterium]
MAQRRTCLAAYLGLVLVACGSERQPPPAPGPAAAFLLRLPTGFPPMVVPEDNPLTAESIALGRRLFYDTRLSKNGTQSCGSCHEQARAFTDGRAQAVGSTGQVSARNSPSLTNVAYNATLTWANSVVQTLEA